MFCSVNIIVYNYTAIKSEMLASIIVSVLYIITNMASFKLSVFS